MRNGTLYFPSGKEVSLADTTDLCIAAHPDDMELMAYPAIYDCGRARDKAFTGVVLTDGAGSVVGDAIRNSSAAEIIEIRKAEQLKAAEIGGYHAQYLLGFSSAQLRSLRPDIIQTLVEIIEACRPRTLYIHNFADKHDTHVAAALAALAALRALPMEVRPEKVYAMEVWRSLDWLGDDRKTVFDQYGDPQLERALLTVFRSQIAGSKRYDDGVIGRRAANAVFLSGYQKDSAAGACYGMDMTDFVFSGRPVAEFISEAIDEFKSDVANRIERIEKGENLV